MDNSTFYDIFKPRWLFNSSKQANRAQPEAKKRLPGLSGGGQPLTYDFNVITDPSTRAGSGISRVCDYGSSFKSGKKTRLNRNCRKNSFDSFCVKFRMNR